MTIYVSVDLDYFAYDMQYVDESPRKQCEISLNALQGIVETIGIKPYVTIGHDLHCFDVARCRANKLINIDQHSDFCEETNADAKEYFADKGSNQDLWAVMMYLIQKNRCWLNEANWVNFSPLYGKSTRVEHWYPFKRPGFSHLCRNNEEISRPIDRLVGPNGQASRYKNRQVKLSNIVSAIKKIKEDIVGFGIAVSPFWLYVAREDEWSSLFVDAVLQLDIFKGWKYADLFEGMENRFALCKKDDLPFDARLKGAKLEFSDKLSWGSPEFYDLITEFGTFRIDVNHVPANRISIQQAINAINQCTA